MERTGGNNRAVLGLIFAASFASLAYELALIRVFSISLWYHFAFMVISIAMLGIGASGTMLSVFPGLRDLRRVPCYALMLAVMLPASYLLANAVPFDPARLSWDRLPLPKRLPWSSFIPMTTGASTPPFLNYLTLRWIRRIYLP